MNILAVLGVVAIVVGVLGLLGVIGITLVPSILIIVGGIVLILVSYNGTRFTR